MPEDRITRTDVEVARNKFIDILDKHLIQQGWTESSDGYHVWSKGKRYLLTNEEAFSNDTS